MNVYLSYLVETPIFVQTYGGWATLEITIKFATFRQNYNNT